MKPSNDREAVQLIIDGLIKVGCVPTVARDGANEDLEWKDAESPEEFLEHLLSCDEGVLFLNLPTGTPEFGPDSTFIYFVYGNDPEEVACDHGVSLSPYIDPIIEPWWS